MDPDKLLAYVDTADSPAGPLRFAVDEQGALLRLQFDEGRYGRTLAQELEREGRELRWEPGRTARARAELLEYAAGGRRSFAIPLALIGSAWQVDVWRALLAIPFGETRTYTQVAAQIGRPTAARAVGRAVATNRLPLVVPCHRVLGADGSLTGFAGGTHLKERLLAHEAAERAAGERNAG